MANQTECKCGCGTPLFRSGPGPSSYADSCRRAYRAAVSKRYRQNAKMRPGFERPYLREQHGMTEAEYARMVVDQNGQCAGCGRTPPFAGNRQLHIDHDHDCCPRGGRSCEKCRRGLLCPDCNMALGLLRDSMKTLENLAAYLRKYER